MRLASVNDEGRSVLEESGKRIPDTSQRARISFRCTGVRGSSR